MIAAIKTLVVDEISLVRSDMFAAIDYRLRQYAPSSGSCLLPFGGRQLILCGDFFQLPPVVTDTNIGGHSVGEEVTIAVKPYFEYLCQELFKFYTGQKNIDLLQTFYGLLRHI